VANWFGRLKPLKRRAGLDLMTSAALMLLFSGAQALAEDEPAARAPLPPPLRVAPAETRTRQTPDPAPSRSQSDPATPAIRFDRPKPQFAPQKPRTSYLGTSIAKKREAPARHAIHSMDTEARRQAHGSVASEKRQKRDRSPAELGMGQLSPPSDYPNPPIGSTTESTLAEPRQAPPLYYPNYFAGPPAYGYAPRYPYAWVPPGPEVFR
jgi:hypothetical protein